jgi:hypothetical protein
MAGRGVLEDGVTTETGAGTPQGSPISPLLANVALHVLDQAWARDGRSPGTLVRYADDFVILCRTRQQAEQAHRLVARYYLQRWPATRAMNAIRVKIREATDRRFLGHSLAWIVGNLNRILRGWGAYFRRGNSARKFADIDSYVHERLAIFASIKLGLRYHRN